MLLPVRNLILVGVALLSLPACKSRSEAQPVAAEPSSKPDHEPRLTSRYDTSPWGVLGWQTRQHNTITFTNEGETVFLRCTVQNSPEVKCRWSKEIPGAPGEWDRGKAKLTAHPDRSLTGTWGNGDSDDDGGPCKLVPKR
jgi:hypothetical protein